MNHNTLLADQLRQVISSLTPDSTTQDVYNSVEEAFVLAGFRAAVSSTHVRAILVIKLDEIGDVVLSSAFLRELRRNNPQAHITLIVKDQCRNLVELCPYINRLLSFDGLNYLKKHGFFTALQLTLEFCIDHLWSQQYDLCLIPRFDHDMYLATFLAYLSGAKHRIGYSETVTPWKARNNKGYNQFLTGALSTTAVEHEVVSNLKLLRYLGGKVAHDQLEVWTGAHDEQLAQTVVPHFPGNTIAISPGAEGSVRSWPIERYIELAKRLQADHPIRFVILGAPGEEQPALQFVEAIAGQTINLLGKTTLRQSAAILRQCDLYFGRNTGLSHIAAAVDIPVVEITCQPRTGHAMHVLSPIRFRPYNNKSVVLQPDEYLPPCHGNCSAKQPHCIMQIEIEEAYNAVLTVIADEIE